MALLHIRNQSGLSLCACLAVLLHLNTCVFVRNVSEESVTKYAQAWYVCTACVCGPAINTWCWALTVPREALMTQGVEGGWVVTVELWLAMGHSGSSQGQSGCTYDGNSLGSIQAFGLVPTLDKASDSIIGLWVRAMCREGRMVS